LLLDYPGLAPPPRSPQTWTQVIAGNRLIESLHDDRAPSLAPGANAPGGTGIVAAQSDCPFKAVARHRLGAAPWPSAPAGLSPPERGMLLHATMAAFWNILRNQTTLAALDSSARHRHIEAAVAVALAQLPPARWRVLPAVVRAGEAQRIATLLDAWLTVELRRPSFSVMGTEISTSLELEQMRFRLRIDRVDALEDGGSVIVDYKSGPSERPTAWFDERPRASQLGMYALAQRAAQPDTPLRAIAFAQFKPEDIAAIGLAADSGAWPDLTELSKFGRFRKWRDMESWWRMQLGALAREIAGGWAAVTPRKSPSPCRQCKLQSLCRIDSVQIVDDEDREDD
jgi:ATP-dependent helicase/nuclease subunit B